MQGPEDGDVGEAKLEATVVARARIPRRLSVEPNRARIGAKNGFRTAALLAALALQIPRAGYGQHTALPILPTPNIDPDVSGVTLKSVAFYGMAGFDEYVGELWPVAARVVVHVGRLSFAGGLGVLADPDLQNELTLGVGLGYDLHYFTRLILPRITGQVALGYTEIDALAGKIRRWDLPVGLGLSVYAPLLTFNIEPFLAPRLHVRVLDRGEVESDSETELGFGLSYGLEVTYVGFDPLGIGLFVAGESLWIDDPIDDGDDYEGPGSAGLKASLALP